MPRQPNRYAIHLMLAGGHHQVVHFRTLEEFQNWYGGVLTVAATDTFVNVPINDLDSEYLVVRAGSVLGLRVEPVYSTMDLD
ncbi:MAG: hypothetical protein VKO65_08310 [Cyanobacteriota bacterium]|nr:hypothetical protein [Cyanobacteriota bacterium]